MIEAIPGRVRAAPRVGVAGGAELALAFRTARPNDEREIVDRRLAMARLVNEAAVLGVGDQLHADRELVFVHGVRRSLVGWTLV